MKFERPAACYHLLALGLALGGLRFQSGDLRGFEGPRALGGGAVATARSVQLDRFGWDIQTRQRFWPFNLLSLLLLLVLLAWLLLLLLLLL